MTRQLLLRAADQGPTYLTWRWLDDPQQVDYAVLDNAALLDVLTDLDRALPHPLTGENDTAAVHRALARGPFAHYEHERNLSIRMAAAVLPSPLARQLAATDTTPPSVRLRIIPSPRLARIPWELLVLPDGRRLLEVADITHDPPATLHAGRDRLPTPWAKLADQPVLYLIDPQTVDARTGQEGIAGLGSVLDSDTRNELWSWLKQLGRDGRTRSQDQPYALRGTPGRGWLGRALRETTHSRLLYYGHASAADDEPGSAAIHLADPPEVYGLANPIGDHRPFTALDVLLGTLTANPTHANGTLPGPPATRGAQIWPMPPRVAIIACDSGSDYRQLEPFGLIMAYLNAGAELLTATRWTLPTDHAFHAIHRTAVDTAARPTTDLMRQVDRCHDLDQPVTHLADWQRAKLQAWTSTGDITNTPLLWAAPTTHLAPARHPEPVP